MKQGRIDRRDGRLQHPSDAGERRPGLRAIGGAASRVAAPIVARRGGGVLARLKAAWTAAVGNELAAIAWPEALGRDGALKLRVEPVAALELQHRAPLLIERVNLFLGHNAVTRVVLVQGKLPLAVPPRKASPAPATAAEEASLDDRLSAIADPELRAALAGLGRLVRSGP